MLAVKSPMPAQQADQQRANDNIEDDVSRRDPTLREQRSHRDLESIGRNPNAADKIFLPLILGLAFIEALALYGFVIAFLLQGKI